MSKRVGFPKKVELSTLMWGIHINPITVLPGSIPSNPITVLPTSIPGSLFGFFLSFSLSLSH